MGTSNSDGTEPSLDESGHQRIRLRMQAEIGAESPFWTDRGEMFSLEDLPLDSTLCKRLEEWAAQAWTGQKEVDSHGRVLFQEAAHQLGDDYELVWDDL